MRLSVFYDHILQAKEQDGTPIEKLLTTVREAGVEAVEIRLACLKEKEETLAMLEHAGLKISCIYEFYEMERRGETLKAREHIETARRTGSGKILVVPGFLPEKEAEEMLASCKDYEQTKAFFENNENILRMAQGLREITEMGAQAGVTVTVEDFDDTKSPLCFSNGIRWFLEQTPGLGYTFDMGNFIYAGEDVLDVWDALKEKISHVHCKDRGEGFSSVAAGDGQIPIAELVRRLKELGYQDYLAIEHFDAPKQEQCMKRSAAFLGELINKRA